MRAAFLLAGLLGFLSPAAARSAGDAAPRLDVALTPPQATVGDRVTAVLTVTVPTGKLTSPPRFPAWDGSWGDAEILEAGTPAKVGERKDETRFRQRLVLTAFRTGDVPLPEQAVAVPLESGTVTLETPSDLELHIRSVLPAGEGSAEPRPAADPVPLPLGRAFLGAAAVLAAAAAALALLLVRRDRKGTAAATVPSLPPREELESELARVLEEPKMVVAHVRLSLALRRYLGRSLGFPAPESTTFEIRHQLRGRHLPESATRDAGEVLLSCDLVKFARQAVAPGALAARVDTARRIAAKVEEHLRPMVSSTTGEAPRWEKAG